jgi:hypothetical protein
MLITLKLSEGCICMSRLCGHLERFTDVRTSTLIQMQATAATQVSVKHIKIVNDELYLRFSQWLLRRVLFLGRVVRWNFIDVSEEFTAFIFRMNRKTNRARNKRKTECFTYCLSSWFNLLGLAYRKMQYAPLKRRWISMGWLITFLLGLLKLKLNNFMELSPSWEPPIVQLLKNFPAFCGTRRFITVSTRGLHWSLSWARSIQSVAPRPPSLRSIY